MAVFSLHNFTPDRDYVTPAFVVEFDITSDSDPIDLSTLDVYFSETVFTNPAIFEGSGSDGYNVSITSTSIGGDAGYHVSISPSAYIRAEPVAVWIQFDSDPPSGSPGTFVRYFSTADHIGIIASVDPSLGAQAPITLEGIGYTFSGKNNNVLFQMNDANEPVITNRIPVVNSTDATPNTDIQFSLHDSGQEGVNITTLDVYINGVQVIDSGAFVAPYVGTITGETVDGFDAFTIVIDPPSNFLYEEWISVRVRVQDAVDDPAAVNTLDTTYEFRTMSYTDVEAPSVEPTQPPDGLGLDACIEFDWLDEPQGLGPDWDTLDVTLRRELTVDCITSIRDDIAVVDGIAAPGYSVYGSAIVIGEQIGYHVIVCPDVPFNELETITVIVTGDDLAGQGTTTSFNISTAEITPPTVLNFSPDDGDTDIDSETDIYFEIHDSAGVGVWIPYLSVNVNGTAAIVDGTAQAGFSFSAVNDRIIDQFGLDFDGYEITLSRDLPFDAGSTVTVEIDAYDGYANRADLVTYSFTISPDITPPTITIFPPDGTTGMDREQPIIITVTDVLGTNQSSINATVNGTSAIVNGVPTAPYGGPVTTIIDAPPIIAGYHYHLMRPNRFGFDETVTIQVRAKDLFDNLSTLTSSFRTFSDEIGPSITGMTPRNGQREVPLDSLIEFHVRDGYDVAFENTRVVVGTYAAILDGVPNLGYLLSTDRISGGVEGVAPGDGYVFHITKQTGFDYNEAIGVTVRAYDRSQNNLTTRTYTWYTVSPRPPIVEAELESSPHDVSLDTNFTFDVLSDGYGVDLTSLYLRVGETVIINNGVTQSTDYTTTIQDLGDGYRVTVDPRYLLPPNTEFSFYAYANEPVSGNRGSTFFYFYTGDPIENPEVLYIGGPNGVLSVTTESIAGNTTPGVLFDGYCVHDLSSTIINEINRLAVATRDHGAFVYSTNHNWPTTFYSTGDEISHVHISSSNNGTLYLANRTKERVDVYYNILGYDVARNTPDVYYPSADGYIEDGYFTDMVVTEGTSLVEENSNTIFIATSSGVFKIETDESSPGSSEANGEVSSYGIAGSGRDYNVIAGNVPWVVAIDVNTRLNYLYVATRGTDDNDQNTLTYIDLATNTQQAVLVESRLIHRLINDIDFQD